MCQGSSYDPGHCSFLTLCVCVCDLWTEGRSSVSPQHLVSVVKSYIQIFSSVCAAEGNFSFMHLFMDFICKPLELRVILRDHMLFLPLLSICLTIIISWVHSAKTQPSWRQNSSKQKKKIFISMTAKTC